MIPQLLQPPRDVLIRLVLADVVDEERAHRATVVRRRDGPVALLPRRVPDLRLDRLGVYLDRPCGEFDADGRLGVKVELIAGEAAQQVGLSDAGVSN